MGAGGGKSNALKSCEQWQHHSQEKEKDMAKCTDRKTGIWTRKEMLQALIPCKAFAIKGTKKNHVKITCCST